ncbi:hypothetical protein AtubIFM54640_002307 [Aspergillus tubingensis]|uniref:Uncharacterized protein n=1 Tax=Aspergillus niger TaxID=5061 RepID=A0A100I5V7_ASPNG|nr:hypothetical protein ABL_01143 [Aspergillus niger]GLA61776.1 hypothetical protein AtubIFM54640_002307 [Aspergillus tubingensis]
MQNLFITDSLEGRHEEQQGGVTAGMHSPRLAYSEDTIVNLISDIYRIYLQLNYISDWEVTWPPTPDGHAINQALCEELHLDPVVISLMKRIPYFRFSGIADDVEFIHPYSRAFVYLEDDEIRGGRDPDRFSYSETPRPDFLLPREIALTCSVDEGVHVILDTKENSIRVWTFDDPPPGDDMDDYRKYTPVHAPSYLAAYLQQLRSLEIIPSPSRCTRILYNKYYEDVYPGMKKVLQEQYGWPYDFQEAEWKAASKVTWKRIKLEDPDYDTDNADELEPEVLRNNKDGYSFHF